MGDSVHFLKTFGAPRNDVSWDDGNNLESSVCTEQLIFKGISDCQFYGINNGQMAVSMIHQTSRWNKWTDSNQAKKEGIKLYFVKMGFLL